MIPGAEIVPPKKSKPKGKPAPAPDARTPIISLKGSEEYFAWLEDAYRKTHFPKATIIRLALIDWAAKHGLPTPPEI